MTLSLFKFYSNLLFKLKILIGKCQFMQTLIMIKNFNFVDVIFSPTLTMFFLTISKINIRLSNDIKSIKKTTFFIHFIII